MFTRRRWVDLSMIALATCGGVFNFVRAASLKAERPPTLPAAVMRVTDAGTMSCASNTESSGSARLFRGCGFADSDRQDRDEAANGGAIRYAVWYPETGCNPFLKGHSTLCDHIGVTDGSKWQDGDLDRSAPSTSLSCVSRAFPTSSAVSSLAQQQPRQHSSMYLVIGMEATGRIRDR